MLVKPDKFEAHAFARVRNEEKFVGFLKREKEQTVSRMADVQDEAVLRQMQGKLKFLVELLADIEESPKLAAKFGA
ncbi:MAG: hypothetical protein KGL39_33440 [Patescibacteria group bacterium]|nr:hypothetical protein [Patescibacteria group bacterium]